MTAFDPKRPLGRGAATLRAALSRLLYGRTWHVGVGTEHAAIARERPQDLATVLAVVEELARVRRHRLHGNAAALRASQGRSEDGHPASKFVNGVSMNDQNADKVTSRDANTKRTGVIFDGGVQSPPAAHALLRLKKRSQPAATASKAIADSGVWSGTNGANWLTPTPTPASASGRTQQAAPAVTPPRLNPAATAATVISDSFMPQS
jgi:hypothetical protein